ncbi:hypothetical protein DFH06DRAFT_1331886 [Mycena polygramma]|nr:hypothetical protein DFH06DRAFT_1331886 [Mycena polygramma]
MALLDLLNFLLVHFFSPRTPGPPSRMLDPSLLLSFLLLHQNRALDAPNARSASFSFSSSLLPQNLGIRCPDNATNASSYWTGYTLLLSGGGSTALLTICLMWPPTVFTGLFACDTVFLPPTSRPFFPRRLYSLFALLDTTCVLISLTRDAAANWTTAPDHPLPRSVGVALPRPDVLLPPPFGELAVPVFTRIVTVFFAPHPACYSLPLGDFAVSVFTRTLSFIGYDRYVPSLSHHGRPCPLPRPDAIPTTRRIVRRSAPGALGDLAVPALLGPAALVSPAPTLFGDLAVPVATRTVSLCYGSLPLLHESQPNATSAVAPARPPLRTTSRSGSSPLLRAVSLDVVPPASLRSLSSISGPTTVSLSPPNVSPASTVSTITTVCITSMDPSHLPSVLETATRSLQRPVSFRQAL